MKKLVTLLMVLALALSLMVSCGGNEDDTPVEKTYSVSIATDSAFGSNGKVSNTGLVLVIDADNKIAAARFDSIEPTAKLDENGALVPVATTTSKVELGDSYTGMKAGSWADQAKAFENAIVGKTADEVANLTADLHAGCTMTNTTATFKALVAEAFANPHKVTFTTASAFTTGFAMDASVSSGRGGKISVACDLAGVVMVEGKVVACVLDSVEQSYTVAEGALVAGELADSKNEQGDGYTGMKAGPWYKQAQAFANSTVGKTVADLANLETVSDALAAAGCTMQNTTAGYKTTIISAAEYAR